MAERERPDGCVTDLEFDAWFAGEVSEDARAAAESHVGRCVRCQQRRAALEHARTAFLGRRPHPVLRQRRVWHGLRWPLFGAGLAAAAALLALLRFSPDEQPAVRAKGAARIGFFVQRDGRAERGVPGQRVAPGDRIRFEYTSDRAAYLAIYSRDAAGTVSVYFPASDAAQFVSEGYGALLPSTVELDDVLGSEKVFALFCDAAFDIAVPQRLLHTRGTLRAPSGCLLDTLTWVKRPSP